MLIDNFLAYTFAGAVLTKINMLGDLAGSPGKIIDLLATTLPAQSTFFMNLIMIAAFNGLTMELLRYRHTYNRHRHTPTASSFENGPFHQAGAVC